MRYIILTLISFFTFTFSTIYAQNYTQEGTIFVQNNAKEKSKSNVIETKYTWKDTKNNTYKIFLSKNGKAFVKVQSKKSGKYYNKYLNEEISIKLSEEYGIKYTPKKK